jgi:hypothetical protein
MKNDKRRSKFEDEEWKKSQRSVYPEKFDEREYFTGSKLAVERVGSTKLEEGSWKEKVNGKQ